MFHLEKLHLFFPYSFFFVLTCNFPVYQLRYINCIVKVSRVKEANGAVWSFFIRLFSRSGGNLNCACLIAVSFISFNDAPTLLLINLSVWLHTDLSPLNNCNFVGSINIVWKLLVTVRNDTMTNPPRGLKLLASHRSTPQNIDSGAIKSRKVSLEGPRGYTSLSPIIYWAGRGLQSRYVWFVCGKSSIIGRKCLDFDVGRLQAGERSTLRYLEAVMRWGVFTSGGANCLCLTRLYEVCMQMYIQSLILE